MNTAKCKHEVLLYNLGNESNVYAGDCKCPFCGQIFTPEQKQNTLDNKISRCHIEVLDINKNIDSILKELKRLFSMANELGVAKLSYVKRNTTLIYGANLHNVNNHGCYGKKVNNNK